MPQYADVVHCTKTRVRIKMRDKVQDRTFYGQLAEAVADLPGVDKVKINDVTGSLLFQGDSLNPRDIVDRLIQKTPLRFETSPTLHPVQRAVQPFVRLSQKLKAATGGEVGLTEAGFLTLLGIGVIQILRGNITAPPWYTAFWYAFGVFSKALVEKYSEPHVMKPSGAGFQPAHAADPCPANDKSDTAPSVEQWSEET